MYKVGQERGVKNTSETGKVQAKGFMDIANNMLIRISVFGNASGNQILYKTFLLLTFFFFFLEILIKHFFYKRFKVFQYS